MVPESFFESIRIGLATADQIRRWSHGEVKKPETINYRTLRPERDGLFCERIFGPTRDWECACGRYKRVRFKGVVCERCGVEVTRSKVRRERMGHIELAAPVVHIWFFKGGPSRLGYMLDMSSKDVEKVIYFASPVVTWVDTKARDAAIPKVEAEIAQEKREVEAERDARVQHLLRTLEESIARLEGEKARSSQIQAEKRRVEEEIRKAHEEAGRRLAYLDNLLHTFVNLAPRQVIDDDQIYRDLRERWGEFFRAGIGAEAIRELLSSMDFAAEAEALREAIKNGKGQKRLRAIKRLKVIAPFAKGQSNPLAIVMDVLPVLPPDLRPMVQLDGGRFATSDLNDLYRRVINRNNRLKRLLELGAPEVIINNEKRMLQEAVDALLDNSRRPRPVMGAGNRPLKSLSDMLKGKQGRFRQNLLGKRVDYSGRSVIVVGPELKLHQCGLPKQMALELFKPFVMQRLLELGLAGNVKAAKRMVERARPQVWDVLEEVIKEHPVLLNRAPTLHRLGIQAFEPVLVEGKAIRIHPLVCPAYNADFDGDQMAVHVPLSPEAQAEARILMLSSNNLLSPAHGKPLVTPTQDMVLGSWYLTIEVPGAKGEGRVFASPEEALLAYDFGQVDLHARVKVRMHRAGGDGRWELVETTVGRIIFNSVLPEDFPYQNGPVGKKELGQLVDACIRRYPRARVVEILDGLKDLGFKYATKAGITIALEDVQTPPEKNEILEKYEKRAERVEASYRKGIITDDERRQELIEIWTEATEEVREAMEANFTPLNPIYMMAVSGARGNLTQVRQIAAMRGLVANPKGEIIPRPIKANFREGLSVLEYFISTHGARKGLADTALRTADSGYLTRRLVDVAQEVLVREEDCGTEKGIPIQVTVPDPRNPEARRPAEYLDTRLVGRVLAEPAVARDGRMVLPAGKELGEEDVATLVAAGVEKVKARSVLTCDSRLGVCAMCYGTSLATGKLVEVGEAVGIIAAQSIGEPGTQLTMRTFHTGGIAATDITHGLPRVVELFEARRPKGEAVIAEVSGVVHVEEDEKGKRVVVTPKDGEPVVHTVPRRARLLVSEGETIRAGQKLTEGSIYPQELLRIMGPQAVMLHLVEEVLAVYRSQGVEIHDKHVEVIVRQMMRRVSVVEPGDTEFLPGQLVDRKVFEEANRKILERGGEPATARPMLLGITKAALATDSWLAAASFQETTRVLTDVAMEGRTDPLMGLKENVVIGRLVPAGTGMARYRNLRVVVKEAEGVPAGGGAEQEGLEALV